MYLYLYPYQQQNYKLLKLVLIDAFTKENTQDLYIYIKYHNQHV